MEDNQLYKVSCILSEDVNVLADLNKLSDGLDIPRSQGIWRNVLYVIGFYTGYDAIYHVLNAWRSQKGHEASCNQLVKILSELNLNYAAEKVEAVADNLGALSVKPKIWECSMDFGFADATGIECLGRQLNLEKLKDFLKHNKSAVITGISGVGKSVLLYKYMQELSSNESVIASCFNGHDVTTTKKSICEFQRFLCLYASDGAKDIETHLLRIHKIISAKAPKSTWFIVVDNCTVDRALIRSFWKVSRESNVRVIFVSNRRDFPAIGTLSAHEIQEFDNITAAEFLKKELRLQQDANPHYTLGKICKILQNNPLALRQVAYDIIRQGEKDNIEEYLEGLEKPGCAGLNEPLGFAGYGNTTVNIWSQILHEILKTEIKTTILNYLEIFATISSEVSKEFLQELYIQCYNGKLSNNEVDFDDTFNEVVKLLRAHFVLQRFKNDEGIYLKINKLGQLCFRSKMIQNCKKLENCNASYRMRENYSSEAIMDPCECKNMKGFQTFIVAFWKNVDLNRLFPIEIQNVRHFRKLSLHTIHLGGKGKFRNVFKQLKPKVDDDCKNNEAIWNAVLQVKAVMQEGKLIV